MKIIVDAMGGDNAPEAIVKGAVLARDRLGVELCLVGRKDDIERCLEGVDRKGLNIVDTPEVITMHDDPSTAVRRKKNSSMAVGLTMLKTARATQWCRQALPELCSPAQRFLSSVSTVFAVRQWHLFSRAAKTD